jgi:hypothetical protein
MKENIVIILTETKNYLHTAVKNYNICTTGWSYFFSKVVNYEILDAS